MIRKPLPERTVCRNKKALSRYEVLETLECGLVLRGSEVKSLREQSASLDEAYARIDEGELWLVGCHISPYSHGYAATHDATRKRKLLVQAQELQKLRIRVEQKGLILIPLRLYFGDRGLAKLTLAVARGKRMHDRRAAIRERETNREMERAMRRRRA